MVVQRTGMTVKEPSPHPDTKNDAPLFTASSSSVTSHTSSLSSSPSTASISVSADTGPAGVRDGERRRSSTNNVKSASASHSASTQRRHRRRSRQHGGATTPNEAVSDCRLKSPKHGRVVAASREDKPTLSASVESLHTYHSRAGSACTNSSGDSSGNHEQYSGSATYARDQKSDKDQSGNITLDKRRRYDGDVHRDNGRGGGRNPHAKVERPGDHRASTNHHKNHSSVRRSSASGGYRHHRHYHHSEKQRLRQKDEGSNERRGEEDGHRQYEYRDRRRSPKVPQRRDSNLYPETGVREGYRRDSGGARRVKYQHDDEGWGSEREVIERGDGGRKRMDHQEGMQRRHYRHDRHLTDPNGQAEINHGDHCAGSPIDRKRQRLRRQNHNRAYGNSFPEDGGLGVKPSRGDVTVDKFRRKGVGDESGVESGGGKGDDDGSFVGDRDCARPKESSQTSLHKAISSTPWSTRNLRGRGEDRIDMAVVGIQTMFRGFVARRLAERRINARAALLAACGGVALSIIEGFIVEDGVPSIIQDVLADGVGDMLRPAPRLEVAAATQTITDEVVGLLVIETVRLAIRQETDNHLDLCFVRDRRNPLFATVDDIVADTLRRGTREVVGEAVRECTEDFMFGRRLFGLVEELIEDEVTGSVGSIASGVYYSSTALGAFSELEEEVCKQEAVSIVAETMAPFEDHLLHLQRQKDVSAIQSAARSVMVKGLQLKHAARTIGQRGRLVLLSDINEKALSLLLAGRYIAILRAAEAKRLQISTSPLLFMLFRRLMIRTGRDVLLEEFARELDRDETDIHRLELERNQEVHEERRAAHARAENSSPSAPSLAGQRKPTVAR